MAKLKTRKTDDSVDAFLASIEDERKRADSRALVELMREVTGEEPALWGPSIVGFGSYHYVYESGREGDWPLTGFSPRKTALTLYIMSGFSGEPELTFVELPSGRVGRLDIGLSLPEFETASTAYLLTDGVSVHTLTCTDLERPADAWLGIAKSFEFLR